MEIIVRAHSGLRYVVLGLLIAAIFVAYGKWNQKAEATSKVYLFALISVHVQLLLGFALYFWSPKVNFSLIKDKFYRFYSVEHLTGMLIAIVLITIGYSLAKRTLNASKHRKILIYYGVGLLLILVSIPWPFRNLGAGWY